MRGAARDRDARQDLITFQLGELDRAGSGRAGETRRGRRTHRAPAGAGERGTRRAAVRRKLRLAVRKRRCDPGGAGRRLAARRRNWPRSIRSSSRISTPATGSSRSSRTSPRSCAVTRQASRRRRRRLQQVEERLALLERLKRKYGPALADVDRAARRAAARAVRSRARRRAHRRARARRSPRRAPRISTPRGALSKERRRVADSASRGGSKRCSRSWRWSAPGSRCASREPAAGDGLERRAASTAAEFFVSPNPGEDLRPLARIVSGGELSRIMLAHQDADRDVAARVQRRRRPAAERVGAGPDLRRGGRRHRRPRRRRRRPQAAGARVGVPGALHHAPAADCRVRRHAFRDREAGRRRADARPPCGGSTSRAASTSWRACSAGKRSPMAFGGRRVRCWRSARDRAKAKGESERAKAKVGRRRRQGATQR